MSQYKIGAYFKPVAIAPTTLHNGTNSELHYDTVENFVVQAQAEVFLGGSSVLDQNNGLRIQAGESIDLESLTSRGSKESWDLKSIYYIGGPWTLVLMEKT